MYIVKKNKKQQRQPAILLAIMLWVTGCASSPDLRPTVKLLGSEFQSQASQVRDGKLGFRLRASEKAREAGKVLVSALARAKTDEDRAQAVADYDSACEAADAALVAESNGRLLKSLESHARLCERALGGGR